MSILEGLQFVFHWIVTFFMILQKVTAPIYLPACLAVIIYAYYKDRDQLKVDLTWVSKFIAVMTIVLFIRLGVMSGKYTSISPSLSFLAFLNVPLEDAFFAMIPFYICKKISNNIGKAAIWILFSGLFAVGHLYQGAAAALITAIYPFFVSRHFALKTSFANVMICHFLYDCFTLFGVKMANTFWNMGY